MKFILISDLHYTSKQPRSRTGIVIDDCKRKLKFIFKTARKYQAVIICSGDVFDSPRDIFALFEFIKIKSLFPEVKFYTVYGQHDSYMRNKSGLNNLAILEKTDQITLLTKNPITIEDCLIYGSSWGEEIPEPDKKEISILAIHKSIYGYELFPDQKFVQSETFLEEYNFNLILSGDIHRDFIIEKNNRFILNTGPIMRLEATEFNRQHKPKLFIYDSDENSVQEVTIPCRIDSFDQRFYSSLKNDGELIDQNFIKALAAKDNLNIDSVIIELINKSPNKEKIKQKLDKLGSDYARN